MSDVLRSALVRAFGLYDPLLGAYENKLEGCRNEKALLDVIERMGREYKGKKIPSMFEIKDRYFNLFKKEVEKTTGCGIYAYHRQQLVEADADVEASMQMIKVSLDPEYVANRPYLWDEINAWWYCYECRNLCQEPNPGRGNLAHTQMRTLMEEAI